jgi:ParB family chromosome partitioning protein
MANPKKISLSRSQDIPFNKLVLSNRNVCRVQAGVSIDDLAEDIARRTLLQSLSVRPVLGEDGQPTDQYEVQAGGRRYRALELLVKQKRLNKTAPIPCVVREDGSIDSLRRRPGLRSMLAAPTVLLFLSSHRTISSPAGAGCKEALPSW